MTCYEAICMALTSIGTIIIALANQAPRSGPMPRWIHLATALQFSIKVVSGHTG